MTIVKSHWKITAKIKPEYIELLQNFIDHKIFTEPLPLFIASWHLFLKSIGCYHISGYQYCPPFGNESIWGKECKLEGDIFTCCGSMYNRDYQIQKFICKVLLPMSLEILECSTFIDNKEVIHNYTHNDIVHTYFRYLQC